jgi:hypothetical protein
VVVAVVEVEEATRSLDRTMARAMDRAPLSERTRPACMSLDRATQSGLPLEQSTFDKSMPPEGTLRTEVRILPKIKARCRGEGAFTK